MEEHPGSPAEDRESLAKLEERLRRDVRDMVEVLRADVPVFFKRAVKAVFEETEAGDALDDAAVRKLKADTDRRAEEVGRELTRRLEPFEAWRWTAAAGEGPPRDAKALDPHPTVGAALRQVGDALTQLLEAHGIPPSALGDRATYRLPTYFVAGHYMKSLVEGFWQTLALHHELSSRVASGAKEQQRKARRTRWEQA
jgi:hypothetical protein